MAHHQHDGLIDATQRCRWKMWRWRRTDVDVLENRSNALVIRKAWTSTCWSENQPMKKPISTIGGHPSFFSWRTHKRKAPQRSHAWFFGRNFGWNLDGCVFFLRGECRPCHGVKKNRCRVLFFTKISSKFGRSWNPSVGKMMFNQFSEWILHCFCLIFF